MTSHDPELIEIQLNGEPASIAVPATVVDAVAATGADVSGGRGFAVAVDGEVVPRSEWETTPLAAGQKVEVVAAVQGG